MGNGHRPNLPGSRPAQDPGRLGHGGPGGDHVVHKPDGQPPDNRRVGTPEGVPDVFPAGGRIQTHLGRRRPDANQGAREIPYAKASPKLGCQEGRLVVAAKALAGRVKGHRHDYAGCWQVRQGPQNQKVREGSGKAAAVLVLQCAYRGRKGPGVEACNRLAGQGRTAPTRRMGRPGRCRAFTGRADRVPRFHRGLAGRAEEGTRTPAGTAPGRQDQVEEGPQKAQGCQRGRRRSPRPAAGRGWARRVARRSASGVQT